MTIEFLYWQDCPSHEEALARLRSAIAASGRVEAELRIIKVDTEEQARELKFPGSPTIRVNGVDVAPEGAGGPHGLTCRIYLRPDGRVSPLPPEQMLLDALLLAGG